MKSDVEMAVAILKKEIKTFEMIEPNCQEILFQKKEELIKKIGDYQLAKEQVHLIFFLVYAEYFEEIVNNNDKMVLYKAVKDELL